MIAIPVKTENLDTSVSPLFGKSKWFAFVNSEDNIEFWKNDLLNGRTLVNFFMQKGVKEVVFQSMGGVPLQELKINQIECFYAGDGRVLLNDAIKACKESNLLHVDENNMQEFLEEKKLFRKGSGKNLANGQKLRNRNRNNL